MLSPVTLPGSCNRFGIYNRGSCGVSKYTRVLFRRTRKAIMQPREVRQRLKSCFTRRQS